MVITPKTRYYHTGITETKTKAWPLSGNSYYKRIPKKGNNFISTKVKLKIKFKRLVITQKLSNFKRSFR